MSRKPCYGVLLFLAGMVPANLSVNAGSFNCSLCAERSTQIFTNAPNDSFLYDQHGRPTGDLANAWGSSYHSCNAFCGTEDNAGYYDWDFLSQGVSSWLIPWLALSAQLPFETKDMTTNFTALLLALGSPAIIAYSLSLTILDARLINQTFRQVKVYSQTLHRPPQVKAIKAARSVLRLPLRLEDERADFDSNANKYHVEHRRDDRRSGTLDETAIGDDEENDRRWGTARPSSGKKKRKGRNGT